MIRLIIIEDEPSALRRLKRLVSEIRPHWEIVNTADSVARGIEVVRLQNFDLILSDIQLSDGTCFEIFTRSNISAPVIFITAYDEFAIRAFEFNSIHYLLKPVKIEQLHHAFRKFEQNQLSSFSAQAPLFEPEQGFQKKLLSKVGNTTVVIDFSDVAYIYHQQRATKAVLFNGKKHLLDQSLDKLQQYLPEEQYFRINRQAIVNRDAVKKFSSYSSDRILLTTDPAGDQELIVSKEKTPEFKRWLGDI